MHVSPCITAYLTGMTCEHLINFLLSDLRISPLIAHGMPERTALHLKARGEGGEQLGVVAGSVFHLNMKIRVFSADSLTFALRHTADMTTA